MTMKDDIDVNPLEENRDPWALLQEQRHYIARLEKERAKLREALSPFYLFASWIDGRDDVLTPIVEHGHQTLCVGAFLAAREALK